MGRSNGILLLLACFLPLTVIKVAYAQEFTLATDKTTYSPGETVIVTITVYGYSYVGNVNLYIEIMPLPACAYTCPTATGSVSFYYDGGWGGGGWSGTVSLKLPDNTTAGHYEVGVLYCPNPFLNNGQPGCGGQCTLYRDSTVRIIVTSYPKQRCQEIRAPSFEVSCSS